MFQNLLNVHENFSGQFGIFLLQLFIEIAFQPFELLEFLRQLLPFFLESRRILFRVAQIFFQRGNSVALRFECRFFGLKILLIDSPGVLGGSGVSHDFRDIHKPYFGRYGIRQGGTG
ncbi:MAG: hypothetical protein BWX55_00229 [Deltaproteobacteria bacterium ADurb.Bin022]|nr:MAG: hypothetical protein BWX55_00229 [Deltaproteobacteria bacterium ADurb.Bin022]